MNTLIIYDSQYGNTEKIAQAITEALGEFGPAQAVRADHADPEKLSGADVVVIGCPTQGWNATPRLRSFLGHVSPDSISAAYAATFDTRFHMPRFLTGSAAHRIAGRIRQMGGAMLAAPESFFVARSEGPLGDGEVERARKWARNLHSRYETHLAHAH